MLPLHPLRKPVSCAAELGSLLREPNRMVVPVSESTGDSLECGQLSRKPKEQGLHDWIADILVRQRGVIAALPRSTWPTAAADADSTLARVVALDSERAASKSWWWAWRLRSSEYKGSRSVDEMTSVHTTDGVDSRENGWFPTTEAYDSSISDDAFDKLTLAGFSTSIRVAELDAPFHKQTELKQRLLLELEAAATGLAPAVLAVFLVHSGDNYNIHQGTAALGTTDVSELPKLRGDSSSELQATVSVTQASLFTLGDVLTSYRKSRNDPLLRPSLPSVEGGLYELSAAIARRVRALADAKMLKLNVTPDTVVFVPNLCEGEDDGGLKSQGYGYLGMETVRGVPMMFDFDPRFTKRFTSATLEYDPDCAYTVMMLVLLSTIRAQYGGAVQDVVFNKLVGRTLDGKTMDNSELPDDFDRIDLRATSRRARARATEFCEAMRSVTPSGAANRETLSIMISEAANDFLVVVETEVFEHMDNLDETTTFDKTRLFQGLINNLSRSTDSETALFSRSAYDPEDAKTQSVEDRLMQLVLARKTSRA